MTVLRLGPDPDELIVGYVVDDPWTCHLTLLDTNDAPTAWPAAPVLEFNAGPAWAATLSEGGTKATWARTVADIGALDTAVGEAGDGVRLSVDGVTQWVGRVVRRA